MTKLKFGLELLNNKEVEVVCKRENIGIYDYVYRDKLDNLLIVIGKNVYKITDEYKMTGKKLGQLLSKEEIKF